MRFKRILTSSFFNQSTLRVTTKFLGKFLVRKIGKRRIEGMISEVEAYVGPHDKASHASRGRTPRTEVMFGKPGYWYVYMIYGMHHCLNIVTEREGYPAAILIRSVETNKHGLQRGYARKNLISGPGRVCRHFKIDKRLNAKPANKKSGLWIEDRGIKIPMGMIKLEKRIGVDYAEKWKNKLWRFWIKEL